MDIQPDQLQPAPTPEKNGSKRDFWIGFIGWWVFNVCAGALQAGLLYGVASFSSGTTSYDSVINMLISSLGCVVFLLNVGGLIFFAIRRKQIALGMLVAFGVSLAISLLLAVIAGIACFVILSQYNNL